MIRFRSLVAIAAMMAATVPRAASAAPLPKIAIIDSGINAAHSEFVAGQVVAWKDYVNLRPTPYDDYFHGTAVASRAAGKTIGAAPGAPLIVAKVLDASDVATYTNMAAAIRWAADQGAAVINMSLWAAGPGVSASLNMGSAVEYATSKGALVVWIAGNGGRITAGTPNPYPSTVLPGASAPNALVVGASSPNGSPWSGSQADPEVIAPGHNVPIAWHTGGITTGTGTSFAAPYAAGVIARMVADGAPRDPDWLKWVLLHCASDRTEHTWLDEGYGLLSSAAITCARDVSAGRRAVPGADARDVFHVATAAARAAQTLQMPAGMLPPG